MNFCLQELYPSHNKSNTISSAYSSYYPTGYEPGTFTTHTHPWHKIQTVELVEPYKYDSHGQKEGKLAELRGTQLWTYVPDPNRHSLLTLPTEIRLVIYKYTSPLIGTFSKFQGLFLSCKIIYSEARVEVLKQFISHLETLESTFNARHPEQPISIELPDRLSGRRSLCVRSTLHDTSDLRGLGDNSTLPIAEIVALHFKHIEIRPKLEERTNTEVQARAIGNLLNLIDTCLNRPAPSSHTIPSKPDHLPQPHVTRAVTLFCKDAISSQVLVDAFDKLPRHLGLGEWSMTYSLAQSPLFIPWVGPHGWAKWTLVTTTPEIKKRKRDAEAEEEEEELERGKKLQRPV
ncbi:hypothetical protein EJ04DRAFT_582043 [Polyplosphaeria fusca]|uniref:Uncharacterized protein n=1 Tax=Polyplosphaeria fusca TaxID=682080 RepID=A0A9P4UWQ9_9PLEO|nr:hypothetical protein EJ04DRAFT_582043 [Polyplosphaeria fusca]